MQNAQTVRTTPLQLALAWSFADIPLLAGVAQSLLNAMKLFRAAMQAKLRRRFADEGLPLAIFAAVAATTVLAFGFGATSEIVAPMLILGVVTAFAETRLRARKK